jgi:hypothetical protein
MIVSYAIYCILQEMILHSEMKTRKNCTNICLIPAVTAVTSPKHVINFSLRVELDLPYSLVVDQLSSLTLYPMWNRIRVHGVRVQDRIF